VRNLQVQMLTNLKSYIQLMKVRLTSTVAFSSGIGFVLAERKFVDVLTLFCFLLGGFCITVAANVINQIIEKDSDAIMHRTSGRPLPLGSIGITNAKWFVVFNIVVGTLILYFFTNLYATLLSLFSLVLYAFVYTPMKTKSSIAVLIGAFPGAFPPMIGWVAATNQFGWEPGVLFGIQFFWQFPHFWAIAWVLDDEYKKVGIKLLPTKEKTKTTALIILTYTLCLLPIGLLPYLIGMAGEVSAIISLLCGVLFTMQSIHLYRKCSNKAALFLMFGSFIYLPVVQIALVLDKI
jgi:protoheme IX farnesyltransferase